MSIILDPNQPVSYTPREGGPTFLLRPPTVADRNKYRYALREKGAQFHRHLDLLDIAKKALDRLLPEDDSDNAETRAKSIAIIEGYRQTLQGVLDEREANRTEETNKAVIDALEFPDNLEQLFEVLRLDRGMRKAFADNASYWDFAGEVAATLFLVGWDNPSKFRRDLTGPTEATLRQIEPNDLAMIAVKVEQMMQLDEARTKNSNSASSGHSEETKSSTAGKTIRRNGHSADATVTA